MSRVKKNRTSSSTVKPRSTENKTKVKSTKSDSGSYSKKRGKGLTPGSRQNEAMLAEGSGKGRNRNKDPRHGSKKKVSLIAPVEAEKLNIIAEAVIPESIAPDLEQIAPELELELLEQDPRLMDLLDKLDDEQSLSKEDQKWLDKQTARHEYLLGLLGLLEDDDGELDDGDLSSYLDED